MHAETDKLWQGFLVYIQPWDDERKRFEKGYGHSKIYTGVCRWDYISIMIRSIGSPHRYSTKVIQCEVAAELVCHARLLKVDDVRFKSMNWSSRHCILFVLDDDANHDEGDAIFDNVRNIHDGSGIAALDEDDDVLAPILGKRDCLRHRWRHCGWSLSTLSNKCTLVTLDSE